MKTRRAIARMLPLVLILLLLACFLGGPAPAARAQITGGPIIDAAVYGNKEFYPGQTAPLLVTVQNEGYLQSLSGFQSQESLLSQSSQAVSSSQASSASSTSSQSSEYRASSSSSSQSSGSQGEAVAVGDVNVVNANDASISGSASRSHSDSYQQSGNGGVEINTQADVPLAATTALGLTLQLTPGDAPIAVVSSDRALLGSLPAGAVGGGPTAFGGLGALGLYQPMQFWIRVAPDAKPGHYTLPLLVTYKQLADDYLYKSVFGPVQGYSNYVEVRRVISLDVVVMPRFDLVLSDTACTDMVPGTDGIICMTVTNLGSLPVDHAVAFLMTPTLGASQDDVNYPLNYQLLSYQAYAAEQPQVVPQSMVVPVQNSQFLGHMEPGESRTVKFKVSISDDAEEGDFPLSAVVSYNDPWDEQKSSNVETFGVHVEPEMRFAVDPGPVEIKCGRFCVANLSLTNNGTQLARDAIVRMNALDPFTVSYDTMYLGDVAPGENVSTQFGIKVKPDAVPGEYYVTLEVKYYDGKDDPHVTKIIRKAILVLPPPTLLDTAVENWPLVLGLAALAALGAGYIGYKWLARRRKPPGPKPALPDGGERLIGDGEDDRDK